MSSASRKGWLYYSPSFSYITPDLEEVKMPRETKQKELSEALYLAHFHFKLYIYEPGSLHKAEMSH